MNELRATHYLRVEGVNLNAFVFDTRDLSTGRGGGLMLLDAVEAAYTALDSALGEDRVSVLSRGASTGLFAIDTADAPAAAAAVRSALATSHPLATFVVDVAPAADFRRSVEALLAANRWRQMQAASLSIPPKNAAHLDKPACELDGVRPAVADKDHRAPRWERDPNAFLSHSVAERRRYGVVEKNRFYRRIAARVAVADPETGGALKSKVDSLRFATEFEQIASTGAGERAGAAKPRLDGKLAVFYADGNSFGKKQSTHCTEAPRQAAFDEYLRGKRERFLVEFLAEECCEAGWQHRPQRGQDGLVRFETLLWGGDELMFVMPAARGWAFATRFFERLGALNLRNDRVGLPAEPLTHAAALVFCQHHAPIDRIKRLAQHQMAAYVKTVSQRAENALAVVALESFDHLGSGYEPAMRRRYNDAIPLESVVLASIAERPLQKRLALIADGIAALQRSGEFPRSQLRALVRRIIDSGDPAEAARLAAIKSDRDSWKLPDELRTVEPTERRLIGEQLLPLFADAATLWIELEELWEYALP